MGRGKHHRRSNSPKRGSPYNLRDAFSSRRQHRIFPRQQQVSPRQQQVSSRHLQVSPRQQQVSSSHLQVSPRQQLPDPLQIWIDPRSGSESQRMDLAAVLIKIIVSFNGTTTLPCLENELFQERNWKFADCENGLRDFIEHFNNVFILQKFGDLGEDTISCNPSVDICSTHISNPGTCRRNCEALHVCKFYLLSTCDIENCKFGHNLKSDHHNQMVLKTRLLNELDTFGIRGIFRKFSNRHGPTIPSVCTYFNAKGCKSNPCPFLHICQHYIDGDCKYGSGCKRPHNIHGNQPGQLLLKYGLRNERTDRLLRLIKKPKTTTSGSTNMQTIKSKYGKYPCEHLFAGSNVQSREGMFVNGPKNGTKNNWFKSQDRVVNHKYVGMNPSLMANDENKIIGNILNGDSNKLSPYVPTKEFSDTTSTSSNSTTCSNIESKDNDNKLPDSPSSENNNTIDIGSTDLQPTQVTEDEPMEGTSYPCNSKCNEDKIEIPQTDKIQSQSAYDFNEITSWQFTDVDKAKEKDIPESERKKIEQKYQNYLVAKEHYITIDGTVYKIDFSTMEGIPYGEEDKSKIMLARSARIIKAEKTSM